MSNSLAIPPSDPNYRYTGPTGQGIEEVPLMVRYWHIAQRRKWLIAAIILGTLLLGLVLTLLATPQYTATSRIEISRQQKNITNVEGVEAETNTFDLEFYQTQYSLLESHSLARRVVRELKLASDPAFFAAHGIETEGEGSGAGNGLPLTPDQVTSRESTAVALLLGNINISPIRASSLIDISYTSGSQEISARVVNNWAQQFIADSFDRRFASTADARKILENRLADMRSRLESSERDLVNYAREKGIVSLGTTESPDGKTKTEKTLVASNLEALNAALAEATADRIAAQSRSGGRGAGQQLAMQSSTLSGLRQQKAKLEADYQNLMIQFEPGYPAARAIQSEIEVINRGIAREEGRMKSAVSGQYAEALEREQVLLSRVESLKSELSGERSDIIQYNIYQREVDNNRILYDGLLQRYKEIGVAGVTANNIAIVDPAQVPDGPSSPNLPINMVLALMIGLGLAGATVFTLEQMDESLRDPSQVPGALGTALLGAIFELVGEDVIEDLADVKSRTSEAYLTVRSNLSFLTEHGVPKSASFTSTEAAEGKSSCAAALAILLGRTGRNVLLIDADMRSPSQAGLMNIDGERGLSNYLSGDDNWEGYIQQAAAHPGVSLMPAGSVPPNAAELLSTDRLGHLVTEGLKSYDHVLIDSPPVLGLADAPLIGGVVEGTVYIIEADRVAKRGILTAMQRLREANVRIFGVIMTKLNPEDATMGYGYGYGYGYGDTSKKG